MPVPDVSQESFFKEALTTVTRPIGVVVIIIAVVVQLGDAVITIISSKDGEISHIIIVLCIMLGFLLLLYIISVINHQLDVRNERILREKEIDNLKEVIQERNLREMGINTGQSVS